jgi:hypothetical protein
MNWSALVQDRCPRCNDKLHGSAPLDRIRACSGSHCLFKINIDKFNQIVENEVKRQNRKPFEFNPDGNLERLNNL